jgi:DNA repair exonuclease SbcCD ATPase subunit
VLFRSIRREEDEINEEMTNYKKMITYKQYEEVMKELFETERYKEVKMQMEYWRKLKGMKERMKEYEELVKNRRVLQEKKDTMIRDLGGIEYEKKWNDDEKKKKTEFKRWGDEIGKMLLVINGLSARMDGYREWLMCEKVGRTIVSYANEIISKLHGNNDWELGYELFDKKDNGTLKWYMLENGKRVYIEGASGFQKFAMNLSVRIALSQMIGGVRSKQLIIDEGFTSADMEHLSRVPDFLRGLIGLYDSVIIVSHLEKLKEGVDNYVMVRREGNESYLEIDEWNVKNEILRTFKKGKKGEDTKEKRKGRGKRE